MILKKPLRLLQSSRRLFASGAVMVLLSALMMLVSPPGTSDAALVPGDVTATAAIVGVGAATAPFSEGDQVQCVVTVTWNGQHNDISATPSAAWYSNFPLGNADGPHVAAILPAAAPFAWAAIAAPAAGGAGDLLPGTHTLVFASNNHTITRAERDARAISCNPDVVVWDGLAAGAPATCGAPPTFGAGCEQLDVTATATAPIQDPELSILKTVTSTGPYQLGDTITYDVTVTNTGNVPINGIDLEDELFRDDTPMGLGATQLGGFTEPTFCLNPPTATTPPATITCAGTTHNTSHTVSMSHTITTMDLGHNIVNEAAITMVGHPNGFADDCQDPPPAGGAGCTVGGGVANDGNGGVQVYSGTPLTSAPFYDDQDLVDDPATQNDPYTGPAGTQYSPQALAATVYGPDVIDHVIVVPDPNPCVEITKTFVDAGGNPVTPVLADVGDTVYFMFNVNNCGDVALRNVVITDPDIGFTQNIDPIAVGTNVDSNIASYVVQATDFVGGVWNNEGIVNAEYDNWTNGPFPAIDPVNDDDIDVLPIPQALPDVSIEKSSDMATYVAGQTVQYSFEVCNPGTLAIDNIVITDALLTASPISVPGPIAPGDCVTSGPHDYVSTVADVNPAFPNSATVTFDNDNDGTADDSATDNHTVEIVAQGPALELTKTADTAGPANEGDVITYSLQVCNVGNVTLTDVTITDGRISHGPELVEESGAPGVLLVDECHTDTVTYTVTAADVTAGVINNTAVATSDEAADDFDSWNVTTEPDVVVPNYDITIVKSAALPSGDTEANVGDTVTFTFTVTNTGDTALTNVVVSDPTIGFTSAPLASLAPGVSGTVNATYVLTAADLGTFTNIANVDTTETSAEDSNEITLQVAAADDTGTTTTTAPPTTTTTQATTTTTQATTTTTEATTTTTAQATTSTSAQVGGVTTIVVGGGGLPITGANTTPVTGFAMVLFGLGLTTLSGGAVQRGREIGYFNF